MAKKRAKKAAKKASSRKLPRRKKRQPAGSDQAGIRREKRHVKPFQSGNAVGKKTQWKPGESGNSAGRPPNIGSPRAQLKRFAEMMAPENLQKKILEKMPDVDTENLSWAQLVALAHLLQAAKGDMPALNAMYKQLDDHGAEVHQLEMKEPPSELIAKELKAIRERKQRGRNRKKSTETTS